MMTDRAVGLRPGIERVAFKASRARELGVGALFEICRRVFFDLTLFVAPCLSEVGGNP